MSPPLLAICSSPVVRRFALSLTAILFFYTLYRSTSSSISSYSHGSNIQNEEPVLIIDSKVEEEPPTPSPAKHPNPRARLPQDLQNILNWSPPIGFGDHYPDYQQYRDRDYDPNRWEGFPQKQSFFLNSSKEQLIPSLISYEPYNPVAEEDTKVVKQEKVIKLVPCEGPHGHVLGEDDHDVLSAHRGKPKGFPDPDIGSWKALGLDEQACFDRYSRLGPYGLNDTDFGGWQSPESMIRFNWANVRWGELQNKCMTKNSARFKTDKISTVRPGKYPNNPSGDAMRNERQEAQKASKAQKESTPTHRARHAVLIRTWLDYGYKDNDMHAIRSLVTELGLQSGGQYQVFLFVHVKNNDIPIFTDEAVYQSTLKKWVPEEFQDMAVLWSESVGIEWYPKIGEWSAYYMQFMPLQWFSNTHPEFDFIWNWEMDARYIGHHHHFLEQIRKFSKDQPRKYLWERNARHYLPAHHGSYAEFVKESNYAIDAGRERNPPVWGPQKWNKNQKTFGPEPPTSEAEDNFEWGVGEEADLITLLPIWDPRNTRWSQRDTLFNFPSSEESHTSNPWPHVGRRVFINTVARFSKDLLHAMHFENSAGLGMCSEMWPATIALHHGFKAVYAPQPVWLFNEWPPEYLEHTFNPDGWGAGSYNQGHTVDDGRGAGYCPDREKEGLAQNGTGPSKEGVSGRWGQEADSPYNPDREHNYAGASWYYWSDFPRVIYARWLGWQAGYRIVTVNETPRLIDELGLAGGVEWEKQHGVMCLPSMLLHPVKSVKPPTADEITETLNSSSLPPSSDSSEPPDPQ